MGVSVRTSVLDGVPRRTLVSRVIQAAASVRTDLPFLFLDAVILSATYGGLLLLRFDGSVPPRYWREFERFLPVALLVHIGAQGAWGLYGRIWRHAGVQEARRVVLACATSTVILGPLWFHSYRLVPLSVVFLGSVVGTMFVGTTRFEARLFALKRHTEYTSATRVIVIGAGSAGATVVREMLENREGGQLPVAILDDDPRIRGRSLAGVPVCGGSQDLAAVARRVRAHLALLAAPSASKDLIRRCAANAEAAGLPLKILRPSSDWTRGRSMRDARAVNIDDLLGREPVDIDFAAISELCRGRRVLITGAGGSIGAEISRQVSEFGPGELFLVDHDETHLHDLMGTIRSPSSPVLADIRDAEAIMRLFLRARPDLVFHAAAHKHVPLLEAHPAEAVRTNVVGTRNIVEAARHTAVSRLVFISTDKAVRPANVLGHSKRLGEQLVLGSAPSHASWCAVRFGNVLGSRGSVIPTFLRQIAEGGPVTVTDPRMTRYFMSIPESVQLVLQASALSSGRDIFMLNMGEPVRILDVAERLIRLSGRAVGEDVEIRVTGIRPGEKLTEELAEPEEMGSETVHPSIVRIEPLGVDISKLLRDVEALERASSTEDDDSIVRLLEGITGGAGVSDSVIDLDAALLDLNAIGSANQRRPWNSVTT